LLLALLNAADSHAFILDDPARDMTMETALRLKEKMEMLAQNGKLVISTPPTHGAGWLKAFDRR
jgi:hypothetical protein